MKSAMKPTIIIHLRPSGPNISVMSKVCVNGNWARLTELVVNEERGEVVSNQTDAHVAEVIHPANHDRAVVRRQNCYELMLEQLVAIEEDVVCKPRSGSRQQSGAKVRECELEGFGVISGHL